MRVASCMIILALMCTTFTGCSLFKKNTDGTAGAGNGGAPAPAKFPGAPPDPLLNSGGNAPPATPPLANAAANKQTTILAGTVTDAHHRPVGNAYIRLVNLEEKESGAPIDVVADGSGHFVIQGVKAGTAYKLIARTKLGDRMLAGTTFTSAPNARVAISVREDLYNEKTPPLPGSPAFQGSQNSSRNDGGNNKPGFEQTVPATLTVPVPTSTPVGNPPAAGGNTNYVPGIADNSFEKRSLPLLNIPNAQSRPVPEPQRQANDTKFDTGQTLVPSCVVLGRHLENMALRDNKGQVWEYRKQGKGKLILFDFWGTWCVYCKDSMPALDRLQSKYGARGFEVIGIAMEAGNDERKEAEAVTRFCTSMHVSYRQLMGKVGTFDTGKYFSVDKMPTLILLSETGDVIWTQVGRPSTQDLGALERAIQFQLNNRKS